MQWNGKEISELDDEALKNAAASINKMETDLNEKRNTPEYKKKMGARPLPEINPTFLALKIEIQKELEKRNIANG